MDQHIPPEWAPDDGQLTRAREKFAGWLAESGGSPAVEAYLAGAYLAAIGIVAANVHPRELPPQAAAAIRYAFAVAEAGR